MSLLRDMLFYQIKFFVNIFFIFHKISWIWPASRSLETLVLQDPQKCLRWTSLSPQNSNLESLLT